MNTFRFIFCVALCLSGQFALGQVPVREIVQIEGDLYRFQNDAHYGVFLVTDSGVVLVDQINADVASWLKSEIHQRFQQDVKYLIYSHHHEDHASGGEVFADTATIVAHENAVAGLHRLKVPTPLPDVTFSRHMTLRLGGARVELEYIGVNHSDDSVIVHFPGQRAVYAADLVLAKALPYQDLPLWAYHYPQWLASLDRLYAMDFDILLPAHDHIGSRADVRLFGAYLKDLETAVRKSMNAGLSGDAIQDTITLPQYADWDLYDEWFALNVKGMHRQLSAQDLAQRFQLELDRLYAEAQLTDENFPGATAAFILPDGRVHAFAVGFSDVERDVRMAVDMRMPSGSIGKTYVAAVALQLAQAGIVDLDARLSSLLRDESWFARVPNAEDLTLRKLLNHTGGLLDHAFASEDFVAWARATRAAGDLDVYLRPEQAVGFVLDTQPLFAVGEGYSYTDTGYILAGIALEKAAGKAYYELLTDLFLSPLGLAFTLPADRRDLPDLAQGYAHESSQFFGTPLEMVADGVMVMHPLTEWTGGGLVNNPQDLVRWAKLLYEGDAVTGDGELDQLFAIGFVQDPDKPADGYGLGVYTRQTEFGMSYGHGGFYPGYNSQMRYFPDHGIAVALQINSDKSAAATHVMTLARIVIEGLNGEVW